nr:MAG TPA: hypothetical protein [Caudoviricetes sp.]
MMYRPYIMGVGSSTPVPGESSHRGFLIIRKTINQP